MTSFCGRISEYPLVDDCTKAAKDLLTWAADVTGINNYVAPETSAYYADALKDRAAAVAQTGMFPQSPLS